MSPLTRADAGLGGQPLGAQLGLLHHTAAVAGAMASAGASSSSIAGGGRCPTGLRAGGADDWRRSAGLYACAARAGRAALGDLFDANRVTFSAYQSGRGVKNACVTMASSGVPFTFHSHRLLIGLVLQDSLCACARGRAAQLV